MFIKDLADNEEFFPSVGKGKCCLVEANQGGRDNSD
jgi:hypothetical protein